MPLRPMARAAPVERSSTRPRTNGPRSLTVTMTERPPWVTRSLVPNGSERCAQVMAFSLKRWPEAVLLPDSLPYIEATPEKLWPVAPIEALASSQEFDREPERGLLETSLTWWKWCPR